MTGNAGDAASEGAARDWYDARVALISTGSSGGARTAYALVKFTFEIRGRRLHLREPEPLSHPLPGEGDDPPFPPDTDFIPYKAYTDFVVQGSAFPPGGKPAERSEVTVQVGDYWRGIAVFGRREIRWSAGHPTIGPPEPFEEIPVTWENAYGGVDRRVPTPEPKDVPQFLLLQRDHPGLYPRNPFGRGYLAHPDPVEGLEMPNLEDPHDLLTPERLVVRDPALWYRQPIPACYDFMSVGVFPRQVFFSADAQPWFPAPEDESLPEIRRGFLQPGYRSAMEERSWMAPLFFQGASHGFIFPDLPPSTPVKITGMHPAIRELAFALPSVVPSIRLLHRDDPLEGELRLHHVVARPAELTVTTVFGVRASLPREFIPGIHRRIPISVQVGSEDPVAYEPPPTFKDQMARGEAELAAEEGDAARAGREDPEERPGPNPRAPDHHGGEGS